MAGDHPRPSAPTPGGEHVRWREHPNQSGGVLLVAFEGWSDAGDAASTAVRYLADQWELEPFADVDPEIFYDFSVTRPRVELDDDLQRQIVWPELTFSAGRVASRQAGGQAGGGPAATLVGAEPQLRWRTFTEEVISVARILEVDLVLTLGALLAEVPHSRQVSVFATSYDDDVAKGHGLQPSRYEGPTGITGVLQTACRDAGLRSAALWAAVPTYVPAAPSPKAALALMRKVSELTELPFEPTEIAIAAASYEHQVDELVADDEETHEYVSQLEERFDRGAADPFDDEESLVDEVERFLREQPE
ncbi:MAG: PAC2 family protein [Acidimicrobiales bacterium]